jgi:Domain of unknown function (DUF5666)
MKRLAALVVLLAASCAQPPLMLPTPAVTSVEAGQFPVCRVAFNGGPVLADRGIGGTGIMPNEGRLTDRGIGDTGIGLEMPRFVLRGLTGARGPVTRAPSVGDSGVVGVITGFGSICIDGSEIGLDGTVAVDIDGSGAPGTALRAGQVTAITATTEDGGLRSLHLVVRHAVSGPIERRDDSGSTITIAGQPVVVAPGAWGAGALAVGDWVAVSGLIRPDGTISATRFDPMSAGWVTLRGRVTREGEMWHIGSTVLVPPAGKPVNDGMYIVASGPYATGILRARALEPDRLAQDPGAYFGPAVHRIVQRAIVRIEPARVWLNAALAVPLAPGVTPAAGDAVDVVLTLERGENGAYAVTRINPAPPPPSH